MSNRWKIRGQGESPNDFKAGQAPAKGVGPLKGSRGFKSHPLRQLHKFNDLAERRQRLGTLLSSTCRQNGAGTGNLARGNSVEYVREAF